MKFRVFDRATGKEADVFCLLNSTGNLLIPEFSNIGPVDFKVAEGYTVRFEPDYRVCGNCKNAQVTTDGCDSPVLECAYRMSLPLSMAIDWDVELNQKPCEHWKFCGVTE